MKAFKVIFYLLTYVLGFYGLLTRPDSSWRSAIPYLALIIASGAVLREVIEHE